MYKRYRIRIIGHPLLDVYYDTLEQVQDHWEWAMDVGNAEWWDYQIWDMKEHILVPHNKDGIPALSNG